MSNSSINMITAGVATLSFKTLIGNAIDLKLFNYLGERKGWIA